MCCQTDNASLPHRADASARTVKSGGNAMSWLFLVLVIAAAALVYVQARASWWLAFLILWVAAAHLSGAAGPVATVVLAIVFVLPGARGVPQDPA
jgi:hypothetical protein